MPYQSPFHSHYHGDANIDNVTILIGSCAKFTYNSLFVQLQGLAENPSTPVWFIVSTVDSESKCDEEISKTDPESTVLSDLAFTQTSDDRSNRDHVFRQLDMTRRTTTDSDDLFPPLSDL